MGLMAAAASAAYLCREAFVPSSGATEVPSVCGQVEETRQGRSGVLPCY